MPDSPGAPAPSRTQRSARPAPPARPGRRRVVAAAVLAAAVLTAVVTVVTWGGGSDDPEPAPASPSAQAQDQNQAQEDPVHEELLALARRDADDALAVGEPDAPVVLIEYSDFQCPYCGRFARETKPELVRTYVDEGVLRIEWRNFPIFGAESDQAARAAWAAGQQGRFWEFHDVAFAEPRERNSGDFAEDALVAMAEEAGVADLARFRGDMDSDAASTAVARDSEEGFALGVTSTPAFLINGEPMLGAQPTRDFADAVERAAERAGWEPDGDAGREARGDG